MEPDKNDAARGWLFAEKLLAEELAESVEKLTDEEVDEELRAAGYDPASIPTADEMLERAAARTLEREHAAKAQDIRVLSPAERRHTAERPQTRTLLLLVAAMFTLFIVVMVEQGPAIVAFFKHHTEAPIGPDNERSPPSPQPPPPTPEERAEVLRNDATLACEDYRWVLCRDKLDEARALDPAGEGSPIVKKERTAIQKGLYPPRDDKGMK